MPDTYDDILAAATGDEAPRRTRKGALKYQPADTDWSLDRLPELQDFYQSTYKRPLPVTVKGQGTIHNKWGYDHRASADISLNPTTSEGQALIAELQRRRIPFLAFDRAIPGSSTNPHIHVGRPSHRTSARYSIGAQVKGSQRKATPTPDTYDDIIAAAVGEANQKPAQPTLDPLLHQLGRINDASDPGAPAGVGELRRIEGREQREAADTGMGRLHQLDDFEAAAIIANRKYVEGEVRRQRQSGAGVFLGPLGRGLDLGVRDPYAAASDVLAGRTEEESITREVDQRIQTSREDTERLRELRQQFTDEDRAQLADALNRMRGQGSISRGIETGSQRVGSGLLYKLGGLADLVAAAGGSGIAGRQFPRTQLGDYLRRQAGRGELAVMQIEAEMPPDLKQQFADFATHAVGALPEIFGATAVAGPVGGFAALGGLEATGRKQSFGEVAKETAKGAVLGAVFKGAGAAETLPGTTLGQRAVNTAESSAAIGLGTYAVEKAFGEDDYNAARSAASNVLLHVGMRVPGEIAKLTTAAERALKSPVEEPIPTVPADLQERLARAEEGQPTDTTPIATDLKTPAIPPADLTSRPVPAEPVAEPSIAVEPATPSKPALSNLLRERAASGPDQPLRYYAGTTEGKPQGKYIYLTPEIEYAKNFGSQVREYSFTPRKPLDLTNPGDRDITWGAFRRLLQQRGVEIPDLKSESSVQSKSTIRKPAWMWIRRNPALAEHVKEAGFDAILYRESFTGEGPTAPSVQVLDPAGLRQVTAPEAKLTGKPPKDQGGYIDLNEIREGVRAGKVKIEEALDQLKLRFPSRTEGQLRPLLNRQHDPLIGIVDRGEVRSFTDRFREREHADVFGMDDTVRVQPNNRWRYEPHTEKVYWSESAMDRVARESEQAVESYLARQGFEVKGHAMLKDWYADARSINEAESRPPVHHSTTQPRTDTGQFSPGAPGGMEAARSQLRTEARKYATDYKRLDYHQARRVGLDIINDDVARNYFSQLRRMADEFLPAQSAAVDRAESLYSQGKYGQATMLAESIFRSLPDKVNEYAAADAAIQLAEMGLSSKADWTKTLQEVKQRTLRGLAEARERHGRTGGLSGGGSTFYDVNKYPEGGRPDHAKIAYILEPVVEALKDDARLLIAQGKLSAKDYVDHVRRAVNNMLQREEFSDWHPLNKSAALGVLVDKLRQEGLPASGQTEARYQVVRGRDAYVLEDTQTPGAMGNKVVRAGRDRTSLEQEANRLNQQGPPAGPPPSAPATEPARPAQRQRSLPKTLEASGRDPGINTTYDRLPNEVVNRRVEGRLEVEGADALETWYRSAPESADRVAAHRVLVDHYTERAIQLADTAPQQAESLLAHARELSNLEAERATTLGQAVQLYSNLLKYTAPGVLREVSRLEAQGAKVPAELAQRLVKAAKEAEATDKEVHRLERKLMEAEGQEAPEPTETATPAPRTAAARRARRQAGKATQPEAAERAPRRYRPRQNAPDTPAERVRRQLDEAAQRRRAQRLAIAAQLRAIEQQRTFGGYWKRAMNITRGLMVSAFSTAMRNFQSQLLRFDIERLDDAVEHTIRRSIGLDSDFTYRNIWRNTARQFKFSQTAEAREILAAHEGEYHRMFNVYAGGVDVPIPHPTRARTERVFQTAERAVEIANFANRVQEFHVRSAEFLAELDLHLRKEHNQTLEQYVRRNGIDAIPLELVKKATDKALEVTFADMPSKDGAGGRLIGSLIEIGNYIPPTVSPVAFPRFMYNNLKFLYQHSPAGMLDLARRGQNRPRVIARSLVGTSMLLLAYQFRSSDHAGEKWYELKFGGTTVDARPFGPFSTYLFLAEAIRRAKSGEKQFTLDELAQTLGASVLGSGTGTALIEKLYNQISAGEWEKLQRTLKTEGGEWGRALLTPVRQVKDLVAAFDASQAINRETGESPFLGPMQESIPYADTNLPPAHLPTTATPLHQERPATKAITGWRAISPKTFLQAQLDELNFTSAEVLPATGNPTLDALQKRLMGPLMDELSTELEADTEFKGMTKKARAVFLRDAIEQIREEVREAAAAEQPELYEQHQEERKPRRTREFEQELNSPGLSRALQLGVPMPIPPRHPDEDDIAYRARLLQVGRQRRSRLDSVAGQLGSLDRGSQRSLLHNALYRG